MKPTKLSSKVIHSTEWTEIEQFLKARLDSYRKQNDDFKMSHEDTMVLRGRIFELKSILSEADQPMEVKGASGIKYP